jgi:hypothetical protein
VGSIPAGDGYLDKETPRIRNQNEIGTMKEPDVPDVLYRGFEVWEHADAFINGVIRFGRLDTCRDFEDTRRRDQDEGKALLHTPIIPEHCEGLNKVCLLCCSVDLDRRLKLL